MKNYVSGRVSWLFPSFIILFPPSDHDEVFLTFVEQQL